jgi:DNA-binding transcriptional ArsR family regulator
MNDREKKQVLKKAREKGRKILFELQERAKGHYTLVDLMRLLRTGLKSFKKVAYEGLLVDVCLHADKASRKDLAPCFPGFDCSGSFVVGDGVRVAKRHASFQDALRDLEITKANRDKVTVAYRLKEQKILKLQPYWGFGVTMPQAVAAYYRAHPEEQAS